MSIVNEIALIIRHSCLPECRQRLPKSELRLLKGIDFRGHDGQQVEPCSILCHLNLTRAQFVMLILT
jgi:hypothetical protein